MPPMFRLCHRLHSAPGSTSRAIPFVEKVMMTIGVAFGLRSLELTLMGIWRAFGVLQHALTKPHRCHVQNATNQLVHGLFHKIVAVHVGAGISQRGIPGDMAMKATADFQSTAMEEGVRHMEMSNMRWHGWLYQLPSPW